MLRANCSCIINTQSMKTPSTLSDLLDWLFSGFNGPLRQYLSLYQKTVSQRKGEG